MELTTAWLGTPVPDTQLRPGDLFVYDRGADAMFLAFKASNNHTNFAVILAELGGATGDPVPRRVNFEIEVPHQVVRKVEGGELRIEPLTNSTAALAFAPPSDLAPNGSLLIKQDGGISITLLEGRDRPRMSLQTGEYVPPASGGLQVDAWRLMWRYGERDMELCRIPGSEP